MIFFYVYTEFGQIDQISGEIWTNQKIPAKIARIMFKLTRLPVNFFLCIGIIIIFFRSLYYYFFLRDAKDLEICRNVIFIIRKSLDASNSGLSAIEICGL